MPQITQLCGLCCGEETTAKPVDCDSFLPITAVAMQFLPLTGDKEVSYNYETLTAVKKKKKEKEKKLIKKFVYQNRYEDYRLSSLL